jgi:uncharacterized protein (DUF1330 family)|nr:DUF1330 domain-containing protein [uncultured Rhodoferax sp.]
MSAYVVLVRERTIDTEAMARYREQAPRARQGRDMRSVAHYGLHQALEGEEVEGVAILQFPSMAAAREWYESPEYSQARAHRLQGSDTKVFLVEGIAPPSA